MHSDAVKLYLEVTQVVMDSINEKIAIISQNPVAFSKPFATPR
jgi:hypothetical protein